MNSLYLKMEFKYERSGLIIIKWLIEKDVMRFLNIQQSEKGMEYGMHISSYNHAEPDYYTFDVMIRKIVETATNERSVDCETLTQFKTMLPKNIIPEPTLYYRFIKEANEQFAIQWHNNTRQSIWMSHKIPVPDYEQLRPMIQEYIDRWDKNERHIALN